jgi:hypothetical protein
VCKAIVVMILANSLLLDNVLILTLTLETSYKVDGEKGAGRPHPHPDNFLEGAGGGGGGPKKLHGNGNHWGTLAAVPASQEVCEDCQKPY